MTIFIQAFELVKLNGTQGKGYRRGCIVKEARFYHTADDHKAMVAIWEGQGYSVEVTIEDDGQ